MAYATYMGAHVKRKEDPRLITGSGSYVGDLKLPGMHYVAFVRSPYAHAHIGEIDASAALALDGVVAVVTGDELAAHTEPMPFPFEVGSADGEANSARTHHALTTGKVRHMGECVAAVIAADAATAADAAEEVFVDWEPISAAGGIEQALEPDAATIFDDMDSNRQEVWRNKVGDVDAAFASAHKVVSQRITSQRLAAVPMEGRSIVAAPDPTTAGLTVWTSTQAPHLVRGQLAGVLRMSENAIRVIAPEVGGGFGVKIGIYPEEVAVASLAMQYRIPLSWVEGRSEHLLTTTHGRGQIADYKLAVREDGRITGLQMRVVADMGAYPIVLIIPELTGWMAVGVYDIAAVDIEIDCVFTNTTPIAAYRGAGRPEAAFYIERMVDLVANELGLDPTDVRRRNFISPDAFPYDTPTTLTYDSGEYEKSLSKALDVSGYASLRQEQERRRNQPSGDLLGIGLATYVEICGFGPYESAEVRVEPSGTVTVFTGISPHGQGQENDLCSDSCRPARSRLRSDRCQARRHRQHTDGHRYLGQPWSGRRRHRPRAGDRKSERQGQTDSRAHPRSRRRRHRADRRPVPGEGSPRQGRDPGRYRGPRLQRRPARHNRLRPRRQTTTSGPTWSTRSARTSPSSKSRKPPAASPSANTTQSDDCGPRISPKLVDGQVHGGLAQGIAQALLEEVVYSEEGQLLTGTLMDYAIPKAAPVPQLRDRLNRDPKHPITLSEPKASVRPQPSAPRLPSSTLSWTPSNRTASVISTCRSRPKKIWQAIHRNGNGAS